MISTLKTRTFLMVAAVLLLATAATPAAAITQIFEVQVNAGENDAEEDSAGVVNLTDATLDLGGLYRKVGLRFANITLLKNAPITRAYIEFSYRRPGLGQHHVQHRGGGPGQPGGLHDRDF